MRSKILSLITIVILFTFSCNSNDKEVKHVMLHHNSIEDIKKNIKEHPDSLMLKVNLAWEQPLQLHFDANQVLRINLIFDIRIKTLKKFGVFCFV